MGSCVEKVVETGMICMAPRLKGAGKKATAVHSRMRLTRGYLSSKFRHYPKMLSLRKMVSSRDVVAQSCRFSLAVLNSDKGNVQLSGVKSWLSIRCQCPCQRNPIWTNECFTQLIMLTLLTEV